MPTAKCTIGKNRMLVGLLALTVCLLLPTPSFAFVFGELLTTLPPVPTPGPIPLPNPPPDSGTPPPPATGGEDFGNPPGPPPPMPGVASAPEPASIVAGLIGAGTLGLLALRKRRK